MDTVVEERKFGCWTIQIKRFSGLDSHYMQVNGRFAIKNNVVDFPIRYSDHRIAYDWPERIPGTIKNQVAIMYRRFGKQYWPNR